MNNPFEVLGIKATTDMDEIRQAFRKRALRYHPDRNNASDAASRFKEIYEAYELLKNVTAKSQEAYKRYRVNTPTRSSTDTLHSILEEMRRETEAFKKDLDEEFMEYGSSAEARQQTLKEEMRRMASEMMP